MEWPLTRAVSFYSRPNEKKRMSRLKLIRHLNLNVTFVLAKNNVGSSKFEDVFFLPFLGQIHVFTLLILPEMIKHKNLIKLKYNIQIYKNSTKYNAHTNLLGETRQAQAFKATHNDLYYYFQQREKATFIFTHIFIRLLNTKHYPAESVRKCTGITN